MSPHPAQSQSSYGWLIFILLAIAGLIYVKWFPYYHRAFAAEATHSIGRSILTAGKARPPAPSVTAALDYTGAYGKAIWQAMVLGLLLGSAVQALVPARSVARVLGRRGFGSVAAGGLLGVPTMMCTCCAAPVVVGLRARSASAGSAIAFWLGNSVLNPATLVFMGIVLGWQWSTLRLVLGVLMVFGLGWAVSRLAAPQETRAADDHLELLGERAVVRDPRGLFSAAGAFARGHRGGAVRRGRRSHRSWAGALELRSKPRHFHLPAAMVVVPAGIEQGG